MWHGRTPSASEADERFNADPGTALLLSPTVLERAAVSHTEQAGTAF